MDNQRLPGERCEDFRRQRPDVLIKKLNIACVIGQADETDLTFPGSESVLRRRDFRRFRSSGDVDLGGSFEVQSEEIAPDGSCHPVTPVTLYGVATGSVCKSRLHIISELLFFLAPALAPNVMTNGDNFGF